MARPLVFVLFSNATILLSAWASGQLHPSSSCQVLSPYLKNSKAQSYQRSGLLFCNGPRRKTTWFLYHTNGPFWFGTMMDTSYILLFAMAKIHVLDIFAGIVLFNVFKIESVVDWVMGGDTVSKFNGRIVVELIYF